MSSIWAQANPTGVSGYATTNETNEAYGVYFTVSVSMNIVGIWFYSPSGAVALPTETGLWSMTGAGVGTLLGSNASPTWSGAAGSGWVQDTSFPSTPVSPGTTYCAEYYCSGTFKQAYIYTGSSPSAWFPTTSSDGNITAPSAAFSVKNGPYTTGGFGLGNQNNANNLNWLVDVQATSSGGTSHTPSVSLSLTPTFTVNRQRGRNRTVSLSLSPSFTVNRVHGHGRSVSLSPALSVTVGRKVGHVRSVALSLVPGFVLSYLHGSATPALDPDLLSGTNTTDIYAGTVSPDPYGGSIT